jgi:hypothetical protein
MGKRVVCSNEYDKAFTGVMTGHKHGSDSFECALHAAPLVCAHCGCNVIGHGIECNDVIFCCVSCGKHAGVAIVADRA